MNGILHFRLNSIEKMLPLSSLEVVSICASRCGYTLDVKPGVDNYTIEAMKANGSMSFERTGKTIAIASEKIMEELWNRIGAQQAHQSFLAKPTE